MLGLILILVFVILWESPLSIPVTSKLGHIWNSDGLLLHTADQLERYCSNQELSRIEEVNLRLGVAAHQRDKAYAMVNDMISKDPENPNLFVLRANLYQRFGGDRKSAIDDFIKARELIASGSWRETFTPSVEQIDDWLKPLSEESAKDTNAAPVSAVK
jgi:hypothetical protein